MTRLISESDAYLFLTLMVSELRVVCWEAQTFLVHGVLVLGCLFVPSGIKWKPRLELAVSEGNVC